MPLCCCPCSAHICAVMLVNFMGIASEIFSKTGKGRNVFICDFLPSSLSIENWLACTLFFSYVYICVCMLTYVLGECVCTCACMHVEVIGWYQTSPPSLSILHIWMMWVLLHLDRVSHWTQSFLLWLANLLWGSHLSAFESWDYSGPCIYVSWSASTFSTKLSPQPICLPFLMAPHHWFK